MEGPPGFWVLSFDTSAYFLLVENVNEFSQESLDIYEETMKGCLNLIMYILAVILLKFLF